MKIKKIQRNKLFLDTGEVLDVNRGIILEYSLSQGMEVDESLYEEVVFGAALSKAYFLISRRDYCRKEMEIKLGMKFSRKDIVQKAVEKLSQQGYIDDYAYAKSYILHKRYGRKRIEYELRQKGVGPEVIFSAYKESDMDEKNEIKRTLHKISHKDREKKITYLARRGFDLEDIISELKKYDKGE